MKPHPPEPEAKQEDGPQAATTTAHVRGARPSPVVSDGPDPRPPDEGRDYVGPRDIPTVKKPSEEPGAKVVLNLPLDDTTKADEAAVAKARARRRTATVRVARSEVKNLKLHVDGGNLDLDASAAAAREPPGASATEPAPEASHSDERKRARRQAATTVRMGRGSQAPAPSVEARPRRDSDIPVELDHGPVDAAEPPAKGKTPSSPPLAPAAKSQKRRPITPPEGLDPAAAPASTSRRPASVRPPARSSVRPMARAEPSPTEDDQGGGRGALIWVAALAAIGAAVALVYFVYLPPRGGLDQARPATPLTDESSTDERPESPATSQALRPTGEAPSPDQAPSEDPAARAGATADPAHAEPAESAAITASKPPPAPAPPQAAPPPVKVPVSSPPPAKPPSPPPAWKPPPPSGEIPSQI